MRQLVTVRDRLPDDYNFILATWLRGLRYGNDWFELIESGAYYTTYKRVVEAILAHPATTVKVACLEDSPDVVLGYSVYSNNILHWVHVKKSWRNIGIARSLLPTFGTVSHVTEIGRSYLKKHPAITFNPFI